LVISWVVDFRRHFERWQMLARQHGFRSPHLTLVQRFYMNWLTLTVLGAVAAWFEYSYQRSRHKRRASSDPKLEEKNYS
jgi:hypothetical protein